MYYFANENKNTVINHNTKKNQIALLILQLLHTYHRLFQYSFT